MHSTNFSIMPLNKMNPVSDVTFKIFRVSKKQRKEDWVPYFICYGKTRMATERNPKRLRESSAYLSRYKLRLGIPLEGLLRAGSEF